MNKRGHWIFGAIFALVFILLVNYFGLGWFSLNVWSVLVVIGIIAFYSILPDIDHPAGTITWVFLGIGILGIVIAIGLILLKYGNWLSLLIVSALFLVGTFVSAHFLKHRGLIHTMQIGILAILPLWFLFHHIGYCFLGYAIWYSHLLADGYIFKTR